MPYVSFLIVCLTWGGSFILMKKGVLLLGPISIAMWRVFGGATVLASVATWRGLRWRIEAQHIGALLLVALLGYAWPYAIQPHLIETNGSAFIGLTVSFVPLLTLLISIPMLKVYPTTRQIIGVVGGLLCMVVIVADALRRTVTPTDMALAFSVPLSYAVANTYVRRRFHSESPLAVTVCALAIAGMMLLPLALLVPSEKLKTSVSDQDYRAAIAAIVILGTLGTGVGPLLFTKLIVEQGALFAGMVTYLVPIGALVWGWLDSEHVTVVQLLALVGIFCMVGLVQFGAAKGDAAAEAVAPHPDDELV